MKTKIAVNRILGIGALLGMLLLAQSVLSQTNLQFTSVKTTDEGNIQLTWASVSNEVYQIQEADALINTNAGSTTWNLLYDEYPSQGTNTFWLDMGNYNLTPQILNPKDMPMRFYRIVDEGPDSLASDEPVVSITAPSSGTAAVGELTVTVTAYTDQPVIQGTKLYVDGQEMLHADSTTNYSIGSTNYEQGTYDINTCEWLDETHLLFATAQSESGLGDADGSGPIMTGHGVSPFVPVLFSNLIEEISFSQPQFDPSLGETQQVSAVFAANCDWTLQIENFETTNVVLTVTGSGISMTYNWDGTGTGETNLSPGIYYYLISAETNGESYDVETGGSGFAMSDDSGLSDILWAAPPDDEGDPAPFFLYPPGFDTNGFSFYSASPYSVHSSFAMSRGGFTPDAGGAGGGGLGAASQNAPATPQRPPPSPTYGNAGTFGVAYDTYTGNGTNGYSFLPIPNQPGIPGSYIALDSHTGNVSLGYAPLWDTKTTVNTFISEMQRWGWKCTINNADSQFSLSSMAGSGSPFNQVNLGAMLTHGEYGTTADYMAGLCKQMYYPITSAGQYLRLSQMKLGGSTTTNGLKWFLIFACDSLYQPNWNSMQSHGQYPYNGDLHLLLGTDSTSYTSFNLMERWAQYMNIGVKGGFLSFNPLTVQNAWYQAGSDAYFGQNFTNATITFAVAGNSACFGDYIQPGYNSPPGGSWTYTSQIVYTHP